MKHLTTALLITVLMLPLHSALQAAETLLIETSLQTADVPAKKQTRLGLYLSPHEVFDIVQAHPKQVLFIDIRTTPELQYVGWTPLIDKHIPWKINTRLWDDKKRVFKKQANPEFIAVLEQTLQAKGLTTDSPVILICRSGNRSAKAADMLAKSGFTQVYNVVEGFEGDKAKTGSTKGQRTVNGWKNAGLPWSYKLDKSKLFLSQK